MRSVRFDVVTQFLVHNAPSEACDWDSVSCALLLYEDCTNVCQWK